VVNPLIVEGQVHGGLAQGIAQALFEEANYDEQGTLVNGTFVDYTLPSAADLPSFESATVSTPATTNPLGVKGVGEAGTIASTPAIVNAVLDAVRQLGVSDIEMPTTSQRVWRAIQEAQGARPRRPRSTPTRRRRPGLDRPEQPPGRGPVIPSKFDYVKPASVAEAVQALRDGGEDAKILAGGQSLIPVLRLRLAAPSVLIDLGGIAELRGIREDGDRIAIGAMTSYYDLLRDDLVKQHLALLAQATETVADNQVRHLGTLGGSLAHADPAGDLGAVALALEAELVIAGPSGTRTVTAAEFFVDYFTTALGEGEILTEIRFPKYTGWGSHYEKFNRTAQAWSMCAVAVAVRVDGGTIAEARVGLTNMGTTPLRATGVEQALVGQQASAESVRAAAERATEGTAAPSDADAAADYREHLARVLTGRAVLAAAG
jgi:carbon-monoxide dehydrogenase medium subunit